MIVCSQINMLKMFDQLLLIVIIFVVNTAVNRNYLDLNLRNIELNENSAKRTSNMRSRIKFVHQYAGRTDDRNIVAIIGSSIIYI
jgi:uncharacterized membrane protein YjgN (DUF898 family)